MLVFVVTGDLSHKLGWDLGVVDALFRNRHSVAQCVAFCHDTSDGDDTFTVFTFDGRRGAAFDDLGHLAQTHRIARRAVKHDVFDVFVALTELRSVAHTDVILVAVFAEERHDRAVDAVSDILRSRGDVDAVEHQLFAVEIDVNLRSVFVAADENL